MKKVILMIFVVGSMSGKDPEIRIHRSEKYGTSWFRPKTHATITYPWWRPTPKEWVDSEPDLPNVFDESKVSKRAILVNMLLGNREAKKKLVSGRHEYWNQWIKGYEPEEEWQFRGPWWKNSERLNRKDKKTFIKELNKRPDQDKWLTDIAKQSIQPQPGALTRFSNWAKSWWSQ